jgi:hypothetical protein
MVGARYTHLHTHRGSRLRAALWRVVMDAPGIMVEGVTQPMASAREAPVFQLVRANHEQAEAGHKRLREDYRDLEERLTAIETLIGEHTFAINALKTAPQDLSKTTLSTGQVAAVVIGLIGIIGGPFAATWGLRSDIRDINTHMNAQADLDKNQKTLQDERAVALRNAVDEVKKKQDLQQLEIQSLRETILEQRRGK